MLPIGLVVLVLGERLEKLQGLALGGLLVLLGGLLLLSLALLS